MKPIRYKALEQALLAQGCTRREGKGDHEVWTCPDGDHRAVITETREVSPGILRDVIRKLNCLPKGWL